jgi:hypothetical protein
MMHAKALLCIALLLWTAAADAASCSAKSAVQIANVLARGIELNERFKRSVKSGDDVAYQSLRKQVEHYDEETAMPCVRKATQILDRELDEALLRKLMEFAVSHENSADETISAAIAAVFARHPDAVAQGLASFSPARAQILLRSLESGWPGVSRTLALADRQDREARLRILREAEAKSGATK